MMRERDHFLDRLRTLAIVWVLMVHVLYWLEFLLWGTMATVKSWLLLEMPLFFFITGAGLSLSGPRPWLEFVFRSFWRMMIPYWCYMLLCVVITALHSGYVDWWLFKYWIVPFNPQPVSVEFLTDALWYVPVYLLCVLVIPLLRRGMKKPLPVVLLLVTLLLMCERQGWYYLQNMAFYSIWIFAGLHYPAWKARYIDKASQRWELLLVAGAAVALVAAACMFGNAEANMQMNKFPPKGIFLAYSVAAMSLLTLVLPMIVRIMDVLGRVKPLNWGMEQLSRYSLSVFLYQPFAFLLLSWLKRQVVFALPESVQLLGCCVLVLPLAVVLAAVFGPLERLGRRRNV